VGRFDTPLPTFEKRIAEVAQAIVERIADRLRETCAVIAFRAERATPSRDVRHRW